MTDYKHMHSSIPQYSSHILELQHDRFHFSIPNTSCCNMTAFNTMAGISQSVSCSQIVNS